MEGGVPNLEVAQAMVTKKWGEMRVEERASWIQMARSIRMQKDAELKPKPEPKRKGPTIAHVASDKMNTEGASAPGNQSDLDDNLSVFSESMVEKEGVTRNPQLVLPEVDDDAFYDI